MSFQIIEIVESQPQGILAQVSHQNKQVTAMIPRQGTGDMAVGKSFEAEIGYDKVLGWEVVPDFDDTRSGIWQKQDGIHLLGRVRNILDFGDGKALIEVYMQNGPEVFTVDAEEINEADLESNDGLEITVGKLYVYPVE